MAEEVFFTEQLHEQVATYIVEHGGQVETETVSAYVFQKVTIRITSCIRFGGSDISPIYKYALVDGGRLLIQFNRSKGTVPGHYEAYWVTIYIQRGNDGKNAAVRTETT
jgi:hypothetical protein